MDIREATEARAAGWLDAATWQASLMATLTASNMDPTLLHTAVLKMLRAKEPLAAIVVRWRSAHGPLRALDQESTGALIALLVEGQDDAAVEYVKELSGLKALMQLVVPMTIACDCPKTLDFCLRPKTQLDSWTDALIDETVTSTAIFDVLMQHDWRNVRTSTNALGRHLEQSLGKSRDYVQYLLSHGARVGPDILQKAAAVSDLPTMVLLLQQDSAFLARSGALQTAIRLDRMDVLGAMLLREPNLEAYPDLMSVDVTQRHPGKPLQEAVRAGNVGAVKLLLEYGSAVDQQVLELANRPCSDEIRKALLGQGGQGA